MWQAGAVQNSRKKEFANRVRGWRRNLPAVYPQRLQKKVTFPIVEYESMGGGWRCWRRRVVQCWKDPSEPKGQYLCAENTPAAASTVLWTRFGLCRCEILTVSLRTDQLQLQHTPAAPHNPRVDHCKHPGTTSDFFLIHPPMQLQRACSCADRETPL